MGGRVTSLKTTQDLRNFSITQRLARWVWITFVLTFIVARASALLTAMGRLPEFHVQIGRTHVHHLNFGILLLAVVGGYLLSMRPLGRGLRIAAMAYGVGLALTFDEFGMWLHLDDFYWQRASFDAIVVIGALLGLVVTAPVLRRFRLRHWATLTGIALAATLFGLLVLKPLWSAG